MAKKPFVPPISQGLVGKTPKAQRQHVANRLKNHFDKDLPHFFVPRKKGVAAASMPKSFAAAGTPDEIEVEVTSIEVLDDKLRLMINAVGLKTDDLIIVNQLIHVPDGTYRDEYNPEDGIVHRIANSVENPEEALLETIRNVVWRWEAQA